MNPENVNRETNSPETDEVTLEETQRFDATGELIEQTIGRIPQYPPSQHTEEPECARAIDSLKKQHRRKTSSKADEAGRVGEQIDEYRLVRKLGRGGMGEVYYAEHVRLGRGFALKVLHPAADGDRELAARFEREMKAIGQLDHENIVKATGAGQIGKDLFLVMEFVDGEPLSEVLRNAPEHRLSIEHACRAILETAAGLQYVHEQGIVHRDIKPANLMQDRSGRIRILDLGLARLTRDGQPEEELTREQQAVGTVDYMAPEQLQDSRRVDHRTDIYALGVTFYKLLTGRTPFADDSRRTTESRLLAIANEDAPSIRTLRSDLPAELANLIDRMLARNPEQRVQSMSEVIDTLAGLGISDSADEPVARVKPTHTAPPRRPAWGLKWFLLLPPVLLVLGLIVFRLQTADQGELLITAAEDVEVTIRQSNGEEHTLQLSAGENKPVQVRAGQFEILFQGTNADQYVWNSDRTELVMKKGEVFRASIARKSPDAPDKPTADATPDQSPFDDLRREDIDPYELSVAGGGDPQQAASELVAIYGDSRWKHGNVISRLSYSSDGTRIFSVGFDCAILWDTETGRIVRHFPAHQVGAISADGKFVATSIQGRDDRVQVWNAATGEKVSEFSNGFPGAVFLSIDEAANLLINVISSGEIQLRDLRTGALKGKPLQHGSPIVTAAVSRNGELLATAGEDTTVRIWSLNDRTEAHVLKDAGRVYALEFSRDERVLYCGGDRFLDRWQLGSEAQRTRVEDTGYYRALQLDPEGRRLATKSSLGIQLRDAETGSFLGSCQLEGGDTICALAFHPAGDVLAGGGYYSTMRFWELPSGKLRSIQAERYGQASSVDVSPDGNTIATGFEDGLIELRDVRSGERTHLLKAGELPRCVVKFSPDGRTLAACYQYNKIVLWDAKTGKRGQEWIGDALALDYSPDGQTLVTGGHGGIRFWDPATGQLQRKVDLDYPGVTHLVYSADGNELICQESTRICVRDAATGQLRRGTDFGSPSHEVAVSPDGRAIAAFQIMDARTLVATSGELNSPNLSNVFLPDQTLVTAGRTGRLGLWTRDPSDDPKTPVKYSPWKTISVMPYGGNINQIIVSPDGRHLITANGNGTTSVLRLRPRGNLGLR